MSVGLSVALRPQFRAKRAREDAFCGIHPSAVAVGIMCWELFSFIPLGQNSANQRRLAKSVRTQPFLCLFLNRRLIAYNGFGGDAVYKVSLSQFQLFFYPY